MMHPRCIGSASGRVKTFVSVVSLLLGGKEGLDGWLWDAGRNMEEE